MAPVADPTAHGHHQPSRQRQSAVQFAYDVGQNQNMQLGWIGSTGGGGDGAPITVGVMPTGQSLTQGGGDRVYLRWAGYFWSFRPAPAAPIPPP